MKNKLIFKNQICHNLKYSIKLYSQKNHTQNFFYNVLLMPTQGSLKEI